MLFGLFCCAVPSCRRVSWFQPSSESRVISGLLLDSNTETGYGSGEEKIVVSISYGMESCVLLKSLTQLTKSPETKSGDTNEEVCFVRSGFEIITRKLVLYSTKHFKELSFL